MNDLQNNILTVLNETLPDIMDNGFTFTYEDSAKAIQICKPLNHNENAIIAIFNWNTIKDKILLLIDMLEEHSHIINRVEISMADGSDVQFSKRNKRVVRNVDYPIKYLNFTDIYNFGDNQNLEADIIYIFLR